MSLEIRKIRKFRVFEAILIMASAFAFAFGQAAEVQELLPGRTIEREITRSQTHRYKFTLKAEEFFQVRVEQKGVDVILKLLSADGNVLTETDSPNSAQGFETLSFIADKTGDFILEVIGLDAEAKKGVYAIRREVSRKATPEDKAAAAFAEANNLLNKGTLEASKKALANFQEAHLIYIQNGHDDKAAYSHIGAAVAASFLGDYSSSLEFYNSALKLFLKIGNKKAEADILSNLGITYYRLDEMRKALDFFNQALVLQREIKDIAEEAATLNNIGNVYEDLGDNKKALMFYEQSLLLFRRLSDNAADATILNNIGAIYSSLGEKQKALDFYEQALARRREIGDKSGEARTLNNIGLLYAETFKSEKAIEYYERALPLIRKTGDKISEAETLGNLGLANSDLGRKLSAIQLFEQALSIQETIGDKKGKTVTLSNLGKIYSALGESERAKNLFQEALAFGTLISYSPATVVKFESNFKKENTELKEVSQLSKEARNFFIDNLRQVEENRQPEGSKAKEAEALTELMLITRALGDTQVAVSYGKQAVNVYQRLREETKDEELGIKNVLLRSFEDTYRVLADLLIEQGYFLQAGQVLKMLKEEEYFEFVSRTPDEIKNLSQIEIEEKDKELIKRYALLALRVTEIGTEFQKLDDMRRRLPEGQSLPSKDAERYAELSANLRDVNAAFDLFRKTALSKEIGEENSKAIEIDRNLQEKMRKWSAGTVMLYTVVGKERYRVVLTTPTIQIDGKYEIKATELNEKIFSFRTALRNPSVDPRPLGKELYDILIKPLEVELRKAGAKTLVWSLDGALRYIPLAALSPDGKSYLVEKYQNVIITPKTRDDISDSITEWQVLGVGVTEASSVADPDKPAAKINFSRLPGARRELLSIIRERQTPQEKGVMTGRRFMDKDFTVVNFTDSLTKETNDGKRLYTVVHIASHFRLGSNLSNSFLLLGNGQILTLDAINNLPTTSFGELVTLSACNTAVGDNESNGREIESLASVIQTKNGKAVLATLWAVADNSTSLLMSEFYRLRKKNPKLTKSEAIELAQHALLRGEYKTLQKATANRSEAVSLEEGNANQPEFKKDRKTPYAHPYYWSPFILFGNWK